MKTVDFGFAKTLEMFDGARYFKNVAHSLWDVMNERGAVLFRCIAIAPELRKVGLVEVSTKDGF